MASEQTVRVRTGAGESFDAVLVLPDSGSGPGVLLIQEIFGVNAYIRSLGERLAGLSYVVLVPDVFWRIQPHVAVDDRDEAGLRAGLGYMQQLDLESAVSDCDAALAHLRGLPEVTGRVGIVGFCLGGTLGWLLAARSSPDSLVSYYGAGVVDAAHLADSITCPVLLHFGAEDVYIPRQRVDELRAALAPRRDIEVHVHADAGHAFDNPSPLFYAPEAASAAWQLTAQLLARTLGGSQ